MHWLVAMQWRAIGETEKEWEYFAGARGITKLKPLFLKIAKLYKCCILFDFSFYFILPRTGSHKQHEITKTRIRNTNEKQSEQNCTRRKCDERTAREGQRDTEGKSIYDLEFTTHCITLNMIPCVHQRNKRTHSLYVVAVGAHIVVMLFVTYKYGNCIENLQIALSGPFKDHH